MCPVIVLSKYWQRNSNEGGVSHRGVPICGYDECPCSQTEVKEANTDWERPTSRVALTSYLTISPLTHEIRSPQTEKEVNWHHECFFDCWVAGAVAAAAKGWIAKAVGPSIHLVLIAVLLSVLQGGRQASALNYHLFQGEVYSGKIFSQLLKLVMSLFCMVSLCARI